MLLDLEKRVSTMVRIRRTSMLDWYSLNVVYHKEVVGLMHVVGMLETMWVSVLMSIQVSSSVVKRVTSCKSFLRINREVIWAK